MRVEYQTLKNARQNAENALQRVKNIDIEKDRAAWEEAWAEYKKLSSDYKSFLIVHYNL